MARSPVTRTQVDAYRFGLCRLDAALVSRDPVPLHEELRGQRRAAAAGAVLAMLGLAGAALWGLISPSPDWTRQRLLVGRQSGALYAVGHGPDRLVPVANLAAGRLVLAGLGDPAPTATPTLIDDADLAGAPRTASAAVAGAPAVVPGAGSGPSRWAVCDTHAAGPGGLPLPETGLPEGTAVIAGGPPPTHALSAPDAVLAQGRAGGPVYLLTEGTRRRVDLADRRTVAAYELDGHTPWAVSPEFLAAVPEALPLATPVVPVAGGPPRLVEPAAATVCWHWSDVRGEPPGQFSVPADAPVSPGATPTRLAQADGSGPALDAALVPGDAGAVRAVLPGQDPSTGALWLLSGSGVAYGVGDAATAEALGIGEARPAPQPVLALLPVGPTLDVAQARRTVDGGG